MHDYSAQRFVILAAPRSGSNMLCTMLNSHPAILCHHELYNPRGIFYAVPMRDNGFSLGSIASRDARPVAFLDKLWRHAGEHSHIGFKMTHRQNPRALAALLDDRGVKKIVLRRSNRVKTHVSRLIAEQRDVWELYDSDDQPDLPTARIHIDPAELQKDIEYNDAYYTEICSHLNRTGQTFCRLEYQALTASDSQHRVLAFLGLDFHPLKVTSRKQNPDDLRLLVENFDQLTVQLSDAQLLRELRA